MEGEDGSRKGRHSTDRRVLRTRKAIREALLKLMEEQDFQKISIAAIAREADIDRKTFYLHYQSPDEVLDEIIREEANHTVEALSEEVLKGRGAADIAALFEQMSETLSPSFNQTRRIMQHITTESVLSRIEAPLRQALLENDTLGLSHALGPLLDYCVTFYSAGIVALCRRWLRGEEDAPLEDISELTRTLVFDGVNGLRADIEEYKQSEEYKERMRRMPSALSTAVA